MIAMRAMDPNDWDWIQRRAQCILCEDTQGVTAYETETGKVLACCAIDSFTENSCSTHMAIDNSMVLRHGFLEEISRHLFVTCGRSNIISLIPSTNKRTLRFNKHVGFKEVARVPNAIADGIDYVVMQMTRDECKWLEVSDGTEYRRIA